MKILMQLMLACMAAGCSGSDSSPGNGGQTTNPAAASNKVNHIIIVMQENHSVDNYRRRGFFDGPIVPVTTHTSSP